MANGRNKGRNGDSRRDAGGFIALPWSVLDCSAYAHLSHIARSLLLEIARQFVRDNNGRLLCSAAYLGERGWKSADVITRAKRELLGAGFIHETVQGHRPNKASWYAVTWRALDRLPGYDAGALETFKRGAYVELGIGAAKPTRQELYERHRKAGTKNANLKPSHGVESPATAPSHGVEKAPPTPSHGAIEGFFEVLSTPSHGNHLDLPSPVQFVPGVPDCLNTTPTAGKEPKEAERSKKAAAQNGEPIATLADLWATVGCRSQWTSRRQTRLEVAKVALLSASSRHTKKPQPNPSVKPIPKPSRPTVSMDDDGTTRVHDEDAHDLSAWD